MKRIILSSFITGQFILAGCASTSAEPGAGVSVANADFSPVLEAVDTNRDGKMSRAEWQHAGLPASSFGMFEKGRGFVTKADFDENPAPPGIDINGDGKLTVNEFRQFDRMMSAKMNPRESISAAERALAMWEVQNVMSKHAYYHAAALNLEEITAIWVDEYGDNAATAKFSSPAWVMNGINTIKGAYGRINQDNRQKALEKIAKIYPDIEVTEANLGAGHEWVMHTNTTPVIEVAGDGKTAKGIWYSPGMGLITEFEGDTARVDGTFFWEKYAADFVNENGVWKIWHLQMAYDFTPKLDDKWLDFEKKGMVQTGERDGEMPDGFSKPEYSYPSYSMKRAATIYPAIPQPYYTFSETFSY